MSRPPLLGSAAGCGFPGRQRRSRTLESRWRPSGEAGQEPEKCASARQMSGYIPALIPTSNIFCLQPLWVPFKLTFRIRSARRRSRSSTHKRSRKLPESSARKRINSGIKIGNKVSRKACGFLSWTEECVGGGPSRRKPSRVWREVTGGCRQCVKPMFVRLRPPALREPSSKHAHAGARTRPRAQTDSAHK